MSPGSAARSICARSCALSSVSGPVMVQASARAGGRGRSSACAVKLRAAAFSGCASAWSWRAWRSLLIAFGCLGSRSWCRRLRSMPPRSTLWRGRLRLFSGLAVIMWAGASFNPLRCGFGGRHTLRRSCVRGARLLGISGPVAASAWGRVERGRVQCWQDSRRSCSCSSSAPLNAGICPLSRCGRGFVSMAGILPGSYRGCLVWVSLGVCGADTRSASKIVQRVRRGCRRR